MGKYRVCVYAICKNESTFVDRWMDSMSEADVVVVLDTGSQDDTAQKLTQRGAQVTVEQISPWRFDVARNRSLALVPEDIDVCICTDLDEVFHRGWREQLEKYWSSEYGRGQYRYTWSFQPDGSEGVVFWADKVHARHGYQWTHPVHEVLHWVGEGASKPMVSIEGMQLDHHPDPSKSRGQYLPLLEQSVQEDPNDDRNMHYLGREYMFYQRWDECIATLKRHLSMPSALWADERAASMRYIARSYQHKGEPQQAAAWYLRAIAEAPHLREGYVEYAMLLYHQQNWDGVLYATSSALAITQRPKTYICEAAPWGALPHDLRAIALANTARSEQALEQARLALAFEPDNERLQKNVELLETVTKKRRYQTIHSNESASQI